MELSRCSSCQHSFFYKHSPVSKGHWICEYPKKEEKFCHEHEYAYYKERWRFDPEWLPEFLTEEEFRV